VEESEGKIIIDIQSRGKNTIAPLQKHRNRKHHNKVPGLINVADCRNQEFIKFI
jgi:hypothetical protein